VPLPPTDFHVKHKDTKSITLQWTEPRGRVEGYRICIGADEIDAVNGTEKTVENLTPGASYIFEIVAYVTDRETVNSTRVQTNVTLCKCYFL
jgi:methyl coenzyme M reductase subunit D